MPWDEAMRNRNLQRMIPQRCSKGRNHFKDGVFKTPLVRIRKVPCVCACVKDTTAASGVWE